MPMGIEISNIPRTATIRKLRLEKRFSSVPKYDSETAGKASLGTSRARDARTTANWANENTAPARYQTDSPEKLSAYVTVSPKASALNTTTTAACAEIPLSLRSQ